MEEPGTDSTVIKADQLLSRLFNEILSKEPDFDKETVELVRKHLGVLQPNTKAGSILASELINLAMIKAGES